MIGLAEATDFLRRRAGVDVASIEPAGRGAWSTCFGFRASGRDLVIRFGRHRDDFERDRMAAQIAGPRLPVPRVHDIGAHGDGWYAISDRVRGIALEQVSPEQWRALVPALAAALRALRAAGVPGSTGFGDWDARGNGTCDTWRDVLLGIARDEAGMRTHGWRAKLAPHSDAAAAFDEGMHRLRALAHDRVPRAVIHSDLINRNVFVAGGHINGIFDWGCAMWGDPLYDLAWFEFWAPWHPNLDVHLLKRALNDHALHGAEGARYRACLIHIGLAHLAYCSHAERPADLAPIAARMRSAWAARS